MRTRTKRKRTTKNKPMRRWRTQTIRIDLGIKAPGEKHEEQFDAKPENRVDKAVGQGQTSAMEESEQEL